ncbi:MAG: hypothetical protein P4L53_19055 [Candidatus Obscuribacterales bacterium]|nr:hypothetical protein [Candidatus Obscuribacterales bacterium]
MRYLRNHPIARTMKTLLAVSTCLFVPSTAWAKDSVALLSETPSIDTAPVSSQQEASSALPASASSSTFLYGRVKQRNRDFDGGADAISANANVYVDLQTGSATEANVRLKAAAYKKLSQGFDLTADEYRSLGIGCIGYESTRTFFQNKGTITDVYKNSPAAKAGLRVGETIIQDASDNEAKADPTVPLWSVSVGREGDPVNLMVVRHGHNQSLTMLRYNIEDIEDPARRAEWEKIVRDLGFPKQGTFNGRNLDALQKTSNEAL